MHGAAVMEQLGTYRFREALDRVLATAVGRLERDASVGERGPDLNDRAAISRPHAAQRGLGAPNEAEVDDLGRAPELIGLDVPGEREDRRHRAVDPYVDRAELLLDGCRGRLYRLGIRHVRRDGQRAAACSID